MATDPTTLRNLKQLRTFERQLRKFAIDYANGMAYEELATKFGLESPQACVTLAKRLGFPRRYKVPASQIGNRVRKVLKFEDLNIPADFLYRHLHRRRPRLRDEDVLG